MSTNKEIIRSSYSQPGFTINWGAIFAGLVLILSVGWLLFALSTAIGLSVIDIEQLQGSDMAGKTKSVGIAATLWMIVTAVITYFFGGYLSGKVSGRPNPTMGTWHGVVLWACTIILGMILGAIGVSGIVSTATGAVKSVASSGFNTAELIASQAGTDEKSRSSSTLSVHPLVGSLKQGIVKVLAQAQDSSEAQGNHDSTSSSSTEKDEQKNQSNDPRDSASAENTKKNPEESSDTRNLDQGQASDSSSNDKQRHTYHQHHPVKSNLKRAERVIDRIDPQIFTAAAIALIQGDKSQAKEILSSHLDIDEAELDKAISKVQQKAEKVADELKEKAEQAKQYATSVLWVIILSYLAGLLACIGGARLSANRHRDEVVLENDNRTRTL